MNKTESIICAVSILLLDEVDQVQVQECMRRDVGSPGSWGAGSSGGCGNGGLENLGGWELGGLGGWRVAEAGEVVAWGAEGMEGWRDWGAGRLGGGVVVKALVAGPLKKNFFFRLSLHTVKKNIELEIDFVILSRNIFSPKHGMDKHFYNHEESK